MRLQPLISVSDVEASSRWYQRLLGCRSAHGGTEYKRLVDAGKLVLRTQPRSEIPTRVARFPAMSPQVALLLVGAWVLLAGGPVGTQAAAAPQAWQRWEQTLTSTRSYDNPYADATLRVTYTGPEGRSLRAYGLWDGGDAFRIRCAFPAPVDQPGTSACCRRGAPQHLLEPDGSVKPALNKITGSNAGGPCQLAMRTRWTARVARFRRSVLTRIDQRFDGSTDFRGGGGQARRADMVVAPAGGVPPRPRGGGIYPDRPRVRPGGGCRPAGARANRIGVPRLQRYRPYGPGDQAKPNHSVEANRRPSVLLQTRQPFASSFSLQPSLPAAVAHLERRL